MIKLRINKKRLSQSKHRSANKLTKDKLFLLKIANQPKIDVYLQKTRVNSNEIENLKIIHEATSIHDTGGHNNPSLSKERVKKVKTDLN